MPGKPRGPGKPTEIEKKSVVITKMILNILSVLRVPGRPGVPRSPVTPFGPAGPGGPDRVATAISPG